MKTLIIILILLSFLQTTIIPLNLVLIILILRALLVTEKENLYLAFAFGLLVSYLQNVPLGLYPLIFLVLVQIAHLLKRTPISGNIFFVIPTILIAMILTNLVTALVLHQTPLFWPKVLIECFLAIPIYIVIRFWEERFIVKREVKLRV